MILKDNKKDISFNKVMDNIYWKEKNIRNSNNNIWFIQKMNIRRITNSNYLTYNIYHEINRE
jgi:hypothetical protein